MSDIINEYDGLNVWQKINKVKELVGVVKKEGKVEFKSTKYNYQRAEDIELAVREACMEVGVVIIPEGFHVVNDTGGIITTIQSYNIVDIDTGEGFRCQMGGMGQDSGDKRMYKAETGGYKYLMKQLFQIPSEDTDPDLIPSQAYTTPKNNTDGSLNWRDYVPKNGKYAGKRLEDIAKDSQGLGWIKWASGKQGDFQPYCLQALKEIE